MARSASWQMNKGERTKLRKKVSAYLSRRGASKTDGILGTEFRLKTPAGALKISMSEEYGTIFSKFSDPGRGRKCVGASNPYSGKWNFHFGKESAATAFDMWKNQMERLDQCGKR